MPVHRALRKAREQAGYTLEEAAEKIGTSIASLSRIETGRSQITVQKLRGFASFYGCAASSLLDGDVVMRPTSIDLMKMTQVVEMVASVVGDLGVSPSPAKLAQAVSQVYQQEINRLVDHPDAEFDLSRHTEYVELIFRD